MKPYEWITLLLAIIFGLIGAWLYETFGSFGEWLANFCLIPPGVYYIVCMLREQTKIPQGGGK